MHFVNNFLFRVLKLVSLIIPRSKRIWVFGAWQGKSYGDNSKYLFEYVNANYPRVKAVWITKSNDVCQSVSVLGYRCYKEKSLRGIWMILRAGVAFETEGEWDISFLLSHKKTVIIQLWHGMGTKAMKWRNHEGAIKISADKARFNSYYWMSTSNLYTETMSDLLGVSKDRFFITGYARNDMMVVKPSNPHMEGLRAKHPGAKLIIYMPTHRNFGAEGNKYINLDALKSLDIFLREKNMIMVYKPHFHELKNFLPYEDVFSNIILAKEAELWSDVYSYLHYFDLLISDYSSVLTDFMCCGKPVVIFPYDLNDYIQTDAGIMDYFWEYPGGPFCYNWTDVINTSADLLANDTWKEERERCRKAYHYYNDGNNCKRIYETVQKIIKKRK